MNQGILVFIINLMALIIAVFALYQQQSQTFYLKIEVEYGHGRQ